MNEPGEFEAPSELEKTLLAIIGDQLTFNLRLVQTLSYLAKGENEAAKGGIDDLLKRLAEMLKGQMDLIRATHRLHDGD